MSGDWGPWIEHDGNGCPCVGQYVQSEDRAGNIREHIAHGQFEGNNPDGIILDCWDWKNPFWAICPTDGQVIRYRIRKPRGLTILEGLLENLPERVDA